MASGPITLWQIEEEEMEVATEFIFLSSKSLLMVTVASKLKDACSLEDTLCQPIQHIKKQRHHFADKGLYSQSCVFFSSHVWMWELDHKEGWAPKNWCFQTVGLEKTLENPLNSKEIKPVYPWRKLTVNILWKDWCWSWSSNTLATWYEERTYWKRPQCWERLRAGGEGDDRGWDGWMASLN